MSNDFPTMITPVDHVEPVPRRIRAQLGTRTILDTTAARYLWEWPGYPQYYVPLADVAGGLLIRDGGTEETARGTAVLHRVEGRAGTVRVFEDSPIEAIRGTARIDWDVAEHWFEEDEEVFVHPRSPYVRVDALRSSREVVIALDGVTLARSTSAVLVFETGLPTRYYLPRTDIDFSALEPVDTVTACPYKGVTSAYWSARTSIGVTPDVAWSYTFPTRQLLPIAGLVAFYNEEVDLSVQGVALPRPTTHMR